MVRDKAAAIVRLMWAMEEYATKTLISVCTRHSNAIRDPPRNLTPCVTSSTKEQFIKTEKRHNPSPPSFSKMAAKIMDPVTGASTCALGNQRCTKYMGSLTRNAADSDT